MYNNNTNVEIDQNDDQKTCQSYIDAKRINFVVWTSIYC